MGGQNGNVMTAGEDTPLLREQQSADGDDRSEETLTDPRRTGDEESVEGNGDKANQQVGRGRGLLIILSVWGLIFLQGMLQFDSQGEELVWGI
jgi:hypothetical protein